MYVFWYISVLSELNKLLFCKMWSCINKVIPETKKVNSPSFAAVNYVHSKVTVGPSQWFSPGHFSGTWVGFGGYSACIAIL